MDFRAVFLLFILGATYNSSATDLTSNPLSTYNPIASVLQAINYEPKGEFGTTDGSDWNDRLCLYCEEFTSIALGYIANNKTQDVIIFVLHKSCSKVLNFKKQCITLVDYYAPLFFLEVSSVQPEAFCQKVDLCHKVVSAYHFLSKNSCSLCHHVITEALLKLNDPDTQLDIVQYLVKACDALQGDKKKCKKLVIEFAPLILVNAEEFIEKNDVCAILHACGPPVAATSSIDETNRSKMLISHSSS